MIVGEIAAGRAGVAGVVLFEPPSHYPRIGWPIDSSTSIEVGSGKAAF